MKQVTAVTLLLTALSASASDLIPYLDKGYAIAPDQANARVVVFDATKASSSASPVSIVWQWGARDEGSGIPTDVQGRFWQVDEAKLRDGGNTLLVSSSGAAWAEVDVATKKARRCGIAGDNTHSIEKLPDNTLVLAHSTSYNQLQLVWGEGTDLTYKNVYSIYSAHGVEWDVKRNCLWALGYTNLVQLAYDPTAKTLTELKRWTFNPSGHDMRLCSDGKIYFTNWYTVWEFDPDKDTEPKARFRETDVKGFHTDATYGDVYQVASGNYWNDHVTVRPVSGPSFGVYPQGATKMYKVHWALSYPASYTTYMEMSEPVAVVADDGKSVRISAEVTIPHATETTVEVRLNGEVVKSWVTSKSGTYAYEGPVEFGSTCTYSMGAVSSLAPEKPVSSGGGFIARAYKCWYAVDFADPGYRAGQDWTNLTDVAEPGGTWTRQDTNSVFNAQTRTVVFSDATNLCYRPTAPSSLGEDTVLDFRVKVYALADAFVAPEGSVAGFSFRIGDGGTVLPCGYADGTWWELPEGGWTSDSDWADLRVSFDFTSAAAPAVSYLLDGVLLKTADGRSALPFGERTRQVRRIAFTGSGEFGDLAGHYYTVRQSEPIPVPVPVIGGNPTVGGGKFSMTVAASQKGVHYCAFTAAKLTDEFIAEKDSVEGNGESLVLEVTADPKTESSKFAIIVASSAPIAAGTKLSDLRGK